MVLGDSDFVLCIRNSDGARRFSQETSLISANNHHRWFSTRLAEADNEPFWVITLENLNIGYVRFDKESENSFVVSIALAEEFRGQNFGETALANSIVVFQNRFPGIEVSAIVHAENLASLRIFEACGFSERGRLGDFIDFKLNYVQRE